MIDDEFRGSKCITDLTMLVGETVYSFLLSALNVLYFSLMRHDSIKQLRLVFCTTPRCLPYIKSFFFSFYCIWMSVKHILLLWLCLLLEYKLINVLWWHAARQHGNSFFRSSYVFHIYFYLTIMIRLVSDIFLQIDILLYPILLLYNYL